MKHLSTLLTVGLLLICLIAINVIGKFLPLKFDLTEDNLYTITDATKQILSSSEEPVTIKYYFSKSIADLPPTYKAYGERVENILREYESLSGGQVRLEVFDPQPDTEEEEWAQKYGIQGMQLPSGSRLFFGTVVSMLDQEAVIPFFDMRRERLLEYDLSQLILQASQLDPLKIGVLSSLPLEGSPMMQMQGRSQGGWIFLSELRKTFSVEVLDFATTSIDSSLGVLMIVHPKNLSDQTLYAIDQYVMKGGKVIVLVDPNSRADLQSSQGAMMGQMPDTASNFHKLFQAWGIEYDSSKLIGDFQYATQINAGASGILRYPLWMSLNKSALDTDHPITSQLESLLFIETGGLKQSEGSKQEWTSLITTSPQSGLVESILTRFAAPDSIVRELKTDDTSRTLAALVRGEFSSAFSSAPKADDQEQKEQPKPEKHLSTSPSTAILVVADSDFLSDAYSVQRFSFLGQSVAQPINDNLNLILNAAEFLSGNEALMSIRSRGQFSRPFTTLLALEKNAQMKFQEEERLLQEKLKSVQEKLQTLSQQQSSDQKLLITPEQEKEIQSFREEERKARKNLREVRKVLRQDVEQLGHLLLAFNLLFAPLLVGIAGILVYRKRNKSQSV